MVATQDRYRVAEWGAHTWWKPLVIGLSVIVLTPILIPALGLAVVLCAPFAIIALPVMVVTMYGPDARAAIREGRVVEARRLARDRQRARRLAQA